LARDIESDRLDGVTFWRGFHADRTHEPNSDDAEETTT
jgi:hypothetical protein